MKKSGMKQEVIADGPKIMARVQTRKRRVGPAVTAQSLLCSVPVFQAEASHSVCECSGGCQERVGAHRAGTGQDYRGQTGNRRETR